VIGLSRKDVAFRIRGDAVYGIEFARLPPAVAETRDHFERFAVDDPDLLVGPVRQEDVFLLGIFRKSDVPNRAVPQGVLIKDLFLDEGPVRFEDLNAVIGPVADIQETIVR
jgi:hypothetical protein